MTYKTTGTLKEIGAKVGDVVERDGGRTFEVDQWKLEYWAHPDCRIISRAIPSPVSTVTKDKLTAAIATLTEIRDAL